MQIRRVTENKKAFLPLLLLGDEQESQIDLYLERGDLYVLSDEKIPLAAIAVTDEGNGIIEIQNLATDPAHRQQGHASRLMTHVAQAYRHSHKKIVLGTGDVPSILAFYEKRGFVITHRVEDYFTTHYDHPMMEEGVLLRDKLYLEKDIL